MTNPDYSPQDPLIFPIGHYMGAFYPKVGALLKYRKLRVGLDVKQLPGDERFGIWALSHGLPDELEKVAWTRSQLIRAATRIELPNPAALLDELIAQGVVARVTPGTDDAVEFARRYRIQPLMMGLGNTPEDPMRFSLGFVGAPPVVKINDFLYLLWQFGRWDSIWETAAMFAKADSDAGRVPDPERVLGQILGQLHVLLSHNAAYLDEVLPPLQAAG
jgi:hypothetical protein